MLDLVSVAAAEQNGHTDRCFHLTTLTGYSKNTSMHMILRLSGFCIHYTAWNRSSTEALLTLSAQKQWREEVLLRRHACKRELALWTISEGRRISPADCGEVSLYSISTFGLRVPFHLIQRIQIP